ncbi:MAG: methyltransferase domain-containing protein [Candidatus Limnocylindria bacterium]
MHETAARDFGDVTEVPGLPVTRVQLARAYHRYEVARRHAGGKDVLEVACGTGQGLGYLAREARSVVGGDYTASNLVAARRTYQGRLPLVQLDAQALPFGRAAFDVVLVLEALYYFPDAEGAVAECVRVLRPGGRLVVSSVNPAWPDFGRSIRSTRYFDSRELADLLGVDGLGVQVFGAFAESSGPVAAARSLLRRTANRLGLVPGSLRAKAALKRFFYGPLQKGPAELDPAVVTGEPLDPVGPGVRDERHSILYAIGTLHG